MSKYLEFYAKVVLEKLFGYQNLQISNKPDLQNVKGSIGIEVTSSIQKEQHEIESLYSQGKEIKCSKLIRRGDDFMPEIREGIIQNGILIGFSEGDSFANVNEAYDLKCEKLSQGNYKSFKRYELFIESDILANDKMLKEELKYLCSEYLNSPTRYEKIFVSVPGYIYIFNLVNNEYSHQKINQEIQYWIAEEAKRQMEQHNKTKEDTITKF